EPPLTVEPSFAGKATIAHNEPIELRLSRALRKPDEARIAVIFGKVDISAQFKAEDTVLRYTPGASPLPRGEQEMVVYLCSADKKWTEIGRFPIRVLGRLGLERATIQPSVNAALNGQVAEDHSPDSVAPQRSTFQDLTVSAQLNTDHLRRSLDVKSQLALV